MKKIKILILGVIASVFCFTSCENNNESLSDGDAADLEFKGEYVPEFDFSVVKKLQQDDLNAVEEGFIKVGQSVSLVKELKEFEGKEVVSDLSAVNDYLNFKGEKSIDTKEYYYKTEELIRNEDATVKDFATVLRDSNVYSDAQLKLFIELDSRMVKAESFESAIEILNSFENTVAKNEKLNVFEKNTLSLYTSTMKGLMYSDAELFSAEKGAAAKLSCFGCVWKYKWRILGWGVFKSLPKVITCIFSNWGNFGGMFWCILKALGSGIAHSFNSYCGSYC